MEYGDGGGQMSGVGYAPPAPQPLTSLRAE